MRESIGPKRRMAARSFSVNSLGNCVFLILIQETSRVDLSTRFIFAPAISKSFIMTSTSEIRGTFFKVQVPLVNKQAAIIGNTEFLFPAILTEPFSLFPPIISKTAI